MKRRCLEEVCDPHITRHEANEEQFLYYTRKIFGDAAQPWCYTSGDSQEETLPTKGLGMSCHPATLKDNTAVGSQTPLQRTPIV